MSLDDRVRTLIQDQLGTDLEEMTDEATIVHDLGADSLDVVELMMGAEEEFGIEITDEEAEEVRTVKDAIDLIDRKVAAKPKK